MKRFWLLFCSNIMINFFMFAGNDVPVIYKIDIHKDINPTTRLYLSEGMKEARSIQAEAIIIDMNTYGGTVVDADSMRSSVLYSSIPVYVFINNNAASAGALIAIAGKKIFMNKGAAIGAATVVEQTGSAAPDKYQSYMRGIIKTTAEFHGKDTIISGRDTIYKWKRDPKIAEAMVDARVYIPLISDTGKVLTLTTEEALKYGYCDGVAKNIDEIVEKYLFIPKYELVIYQPSWYEDIKGFLLNPIFQGILIMIIVAGIYFELQSPGIGFPSIAALTAAVLYFTPLCMDGVAQYWEIIIFGIGLILIALEIFVIPGFGIAGVSGIILSVTGLLLALLNNNDFDFKPIETSDLFRSFLTVSGGVLSGFLLILYGASRIGKQGILKKIALDAEINSSIVTIVEKESLVGKNGITLTVLRPSGKVMVEGEIYDAISETGQFINEGIEVKILKQETAQIYVS